MVLDYTETKISLCGSTESCILDTTVCNGAVMIWPKVEPIIKVTTLLSMPLIIYY